MTRPVDWTPLAAGDPIPGDPQQLRISGQDYRVLAHAIEFAASQLRAIATDTAMQSDAVDGVRTKAAELAERIGRAQHRYDGVAAALLGYAPQLEAAQTTSLRALRLAREAVADAARARRAGQAAQQGIDLALPGVDTTAYVMALTQAGHNEQAAADLLAAAVKLLNGAVGDRDEAAEKARGLIDAAKDDGLKDSRWDNFKDATVGVLQALSGIASQVALVSGVLALTFASVPFLGPALGAVALYAAATSLALNLALAALGEPEWDEVAWSALSFATLGVGRVAAVAARGSAAGVQGAARLEAGRVAAQSGSVRAAAGLPASRSSAAAIDEMMGSAMIPRNAARDLVRNASREGAMPNARTWGRAVRDIPRQSLDDLRGVRNFDVRHPVQQYRAAEGTGTAMSFMGERTLGAQLRTNEAINPTLVMRDGVAQHAMQSRLHSTVVGAVFATGAGEQAGDLLRAMHPSPDAAGYLRLSGAEPGTTSTEVHDE